MKNTKDVVEANRASLLQAAQDVFYEDGFEKARLVDIAERAGMTTGAIYGHFDNKAGLFQAIFSEQTVSDHQSGMLECYYRESDVYSLLNSLVEEIVPDDPDQLLPVYKRARMYLALLVGTPPELAEVMAAFTSSWELLLENHVQALERGQAEGVVRDDIDPYTAARGFYSILFGHALWYADWYEHDLDGKQFRAMLRTLLVDSLRP